MSSGDSLLGDLDPAGLFALGGDTTSGGDGGWEPPSLQEVAALFPRWEILRLLGRGGMGAVYHARQPDLDRDIAIKLLPIETSIDEAFVQRFQREARTLAKLRHPGIVALHEFGTTPAGHLFFAMEYVDGPTLSEKIGLLTVPEALDIVRQSCEALAHAHSLGIVHRDIKPSNILLDPHGRVKVADFGLAKWEQSVGPAMTLSRTGSFMGTPEYAAPEQVKDAARADHRADIYSLGVLFYEMLTGDRPRGVFQPPSSKSGSDPRLDPVIRRALQERPEQRYQDAGQLRAELARLQSRVSRLPWIAATALLLAGAVWFLFLRSPSPAASLADASPPVPAAEPQPSVTPPPFEPLPLPEKPVPDLSPAETATTPTAEPPSSDSAPENGPAPAATLRHIFSIVPTDPRHHPPASLKDEPWRNFALTRTGGAVHTGGRRILLWDASTPGTVEIQLDEPVHSLAATPTTLFALSENGRVHQLEISGDHRPLDIPPAARLGQSSHPQLLPILLKNGGIHLHSLSSDPAPRWNFNPGALADLALRADPNGFVLYTLGEDGTLTYRDDFSKFGSRIEKPENIRSIAVGKNHLAALTLNGELIVYTSEQQTEPLPGILHFAAGDDFTLAVRDDGLGILSGPAIGPSPRRFRLASGNSPIAASPSGIIVSCD